MKINTKAALKIDIISMIITTGSVFAYPFFHSVFGYRFSFYTIQTLLILFTVKCGLGLVFFFINLYRKNIRLMKGYFFLIPQCLLSGFYLFWGMHMNISEYPADRLFFPIIGINMIIIAIGMPLLQVVWMNTVQNKPLLIMSNILAPAASVVLLSGWLGLITF